MGLVGALRPLKQFSAASDEPVAVSDPLPEVIFTVTSSRVRRQITFSSSLPGPSYQVTSFIWLASLIQVFLQCLIMAEITSGSQRLYWQSLPSGRDFESWQAVKSVNSWVPHQRPGQHQVIHFSGTKRGDSMVQWKDCSIGSEEWGSHPDSSTSYLLNHFSSVGLTFLVHKMFGWCLMNYSWDLEMHGPLKG